MPNTAATRLSYTDIEQMTRRDDWEGWGYLGHGDRNHDADRNLAQAANLVELTADDVFLWANSRPARHFMDGAVNPLPSDFEAELNRHLPALRAETA